MKYIVFIFTYLIVYSCTSSNLNESKLSTDKGLKAIYIAPNRLNVALLLMDGTFNTELTAPMDIFHHTIFRDSIKAMNVFTVANTKKPVRTFEGLHILPDFNYLDTTPHIDILVIPAAEHHLDSDLEDKDLIEFVKTTSLAATYVMSHCDGAFVLAKTGLLDHRSATTFPGDVDLFRQMFPKINVIENVTFVCDDKFITSAGGAKSFEPSLYLCEKLYGKKVADKLAEGMVITWDLQNVKAIYPNSDTLR